MAWLRRDPHKAFGFYPLDRFILGALRALHRCVAALKRFLTEPPPVNGKRPRVAYVIDLEKYLAALIQRWKDRMARTYSKPFWRRIPFDP